MRVACRGEVKASRDGGIHARPSKGTASQSTQFLRPAFGEDLRIEANVLQFGSVLAYAEAHVTFASSGKLVAHSTAEFVF
jgi:acyl-coenzyme A thioesterase PaaI-like protein